MKASFNVAENGVGPYGLLAILRWVMVVIFVSFGMQKFTLQSAQGIAQFITNSPFISWLSIFGLRGEAYVLGVTEFLIAALVAAGAVGSMVTQLAREAGAYVIGTGRAADRQTVLDFGAKEFVNLDNDALEDVGEVDLVFDVIGGDIQKRSAGLIRAGGTLVSVVGPTEARPADGLAVDFVVVSDRAQLSEIVRRVRDGRLRTNIGNIATLDEAVAALNPSERRKGKTIIRVRP